MLSLLAFALDNAHTSGVNHLSTDRLRLKGQGITDVMGWELRCSPVDDLEQQAEGMHLAAGSPTWPTSALAEYSGVDLASRCMPRWD